MHDDLLQLIDLIYTAALKVEMWPGVLERIAALSRSEGAHIFAVGREWHDYVSSEPVAHIAEAYTRESWPARTDRALRIFAHPEHRVRFLVDPDCYGLDELQKEPVYQEFLIPNGMGWGAAAGARTTTGDLIVVDVERSYQRGVVEPDVLAMLDVLRPHLVRSVLLASQFGLSSLGDQVGTFHLVGLPAAVVRRDGRLVEANPRFLDLMPDVVRDAPSGLSFVGREAQSAFRAALQQLGIDGRRLTPRMLLPATGRHPAHVGYTLPVRGAAAELFTGSAAILVLSPFQPRQAVSSELLEAAYGLSPAEARTARLIANGSTLEEASQLLGLSRETLRVQLKNVFRKTGTGRQLELAALLTSASLTG